MVDTTPKTKFDERSSGKGQTWASVRPQSAPRLRDCQPVGVLRLMCPLVRPPERVWGILPSELSRNEAYEGQYAN